MVFTTMATLLAVFLTSLFSARAGSLRGKAGLQPPAVTGDHDYEIASRIHGNPIEQLVIFLPVLWLGAQAIGDLYGGIAGLVWAVGRIMYSSAMRTDPTKRAPGMILTLLPTVVMFIAALYGVVVLTCDCF